MHMWNETIASKGSHEVGSCILKHLKEIETDGNDLVLYSNAFGGQNGNIYLVCLWLHIASSDEYSITKIDHKFMISGHSFLPSDRDLDTLNSLGKRHNSLSQKTGKLFKLGVRTHFECAE